MAEELGEAIELSYSNKDSNGQEESESNSNPFAPRKGKALSWSNVKMHLVSDELNIGS